jgi:hypothetical protein
MKSAFGIDGYKRIYVVDQTYKSLDDLNQDELRLGLRINPITIFSL